MLDNPGDLLELIRLHLSWYPLMELRDVYKLLYQGVLGSEHLMPSPEEFTGYLRTEFEHLSLAPQERLFEPIRPDQSLLRLNLHPFKSRSTDLSQLTSPLLETACLFKGNLPDLQSVWSGFVSLCEAGSLPQFKLSEVRPFNHWLEQIEWQAVHHSKAYMDAYQPAYRLIAAQFLPSLGLDIES